MCGALCKAQGLCQGVKEDSCGVSWAPLFTEVQESITAQEAPAHSQVAISQKQGWWIKAYKARDWRVSQRNEHSQICLGKWPIYVGEKDCRGEGGCFIH